MENEVETVPVQDEASAFLDAAPPVEIERQAAAVAPRKAEKPKPEPKPEPEAKPTPPPSISQHMVELAEGFGLSAEDARGYGSDAELGRALKMVSKFQKQTPEPKAEPKPVQKAKAKADEDDEDVTFDAQEDAYDPTIRALVKQVNSLKKKVKEYEGVEAKIPEHVARHMSFTQQIERDNKLMGDVMEDSGYSREAIQDQGNRSKIVGIVNAMLEPFKKLGITPPDMKQLVKQSLPLVLGEAKGSPRSSKATAEAQREAIQRQREEQGRFAKPTDAPGSPSHRQSAIGLNGNGTTGGALRAQLLDKGIDPGPIPVGDDADAFLTFTR